MFILNGSFWKWRPHMPLPQWLYLPFAFTRQDSSFPFLYSIFRLKIHLSASLLSLWSRKCRPRGHFRSVKRLLQESIWKRTRRTITWRRLRFQRSELSSSLLFSTLKWCLREHGKVDWRPNYLFLSKEWSGTEPQCQADDNYSVYAS